LKLNAPIAIGAFGLTHMKFILGKKIGMTQVFRGDSVIPVTLI